MGLLDDAIREHLELKRRHGADPDEVARQENEALGETRRAEFARPEGGAEPVAEAEAPVDAGDEREPFDVEAAEAPTTIAEPEGEPWLDERDEVPADEALDHPRGGAEIAEIEPEPAEIADIEPEPAEIEPEPPDLPPETAAGPAEAPPETAAGPPETAPEPAETSRETAAEPPETGPGGTQRAPEQGEEDVLEETPEFLQETPEHDRLWFEQRPPRDFDWDK